MMLRHMLTMNRLMYHHHIVTRIPDKLINQIYQKQKEDTLEGDWFDLFKKDFLFISIEMNEEDIKNTHRKFTERK